MSRRKQRKIDAAVRAALGELTAAVEVRLHDELNRSRATQLALTEALQHLRAEMRERDTELAHALERVGEVIEVAAASMEADQAGRRALADVLASLARSLPGATVDAPSIERGERVLGGTVYGGATIDVGPPGDGPSVTGPDTLPSGTAVQCQFAGRWVDGFEVLDLVPHERGVGYRLRRTSDGSVLPQRFDADAVRAAPVSPAGWT